MDHFLDTAYNEEAAKVLAEYFFVLAFVRAARTGKRGES